MTTTALEPSDDPLVETSSSSSFSPHPPAPPTRSPFEGESTKLLPNADLCTPGSSITISSENKSSTRQKPKRVRRNYDKFKVGRMVDEKDGVLNADGSVITVKDRIDALFKPVNDDLPAISVSELVSNLSSDEASEEIELPDDPRYPTLLKSTITDRDIYDNKRLCTRLNLLNEDLEKMENGTSPRIGQQILDIAETKKRIYEMCDEKLEDADRRLEKHKFHSATELSGELDPKSTTLGTLQRRNSLHDFSASSQSERPAKRRRTMFGKISSNSDYQKPRGVIVTTSFDENHQGVVADVVAKLGCFTIQNEVSRTTTHVVCAAPRRTINVLRAICRGCWLLTADWVSASLEAGHWLPEEDYEAVGYFPNCRATRLSRLETASSSGAELAGTRRRLKSDEDNDSLPCLGFSPLPILFASGGIYVSPDIVKPSQHDIVQLVRLCAGKIVRSISEARIIIASSPPTKCLSSETAVVSPNWLLDSIMATRVLPASEFAVTNENEAPPLDSLNIK